MADIIRSTQLDGADLMQDFKRLVAQINEEFAEDLLSPLTITLGDEFQGITNALETTIDIIFQIDKYLLAMDFNVRYSINFGKIDTSINSKEAYEMLGAGLTAARRNLTELKTSNERAIIGGYDQLVNDQFNYAFALYYHFYDDWTEAERAIVLDFFNGNDYKAVAKHFNKDISSMWRKEKSLCLKEFKTTKLLIRSLLRYAN